MMNPEPRVSLSGAMSLFPSSLRVVVEILTTDGCTFSIKSANEGSVDCACAETVDSIVTAPKTQKLSLRISYFPSRF